MFPVLAIVLASPFNMAGVTLDDAYAFGVSKPAVRSLWTLSQKHGDVMRDEVRSHNHRDTFQHWKRELDWRRRCWFLLDDALFMDTLTEAQKVRSLAELRYLLGDADYYSGRMPSPTPRYRPWCD